MRAYSNFEIVEARERERERVVAERERSVIYSYVWMLKVVNSSNLDSIAYCLLTNLFGEGETAISDRKIKNQCQWYTILAITYFELQFP